MTYFSYVRLRTLSIAQTRKICPLFVKHMRESKRGKVICQEYGKICLFVLYIIKSIEAIFGSRCILMEKQIPSSPTNHLLRSLPTEVYAYLQSSLEKVSLTFKQELYDVNVPIQYVYFPLNGVNSLLTICDWGCNIYSNLDCSLPGSPIFRAPPQSI